MRSYFASWVGGAQRTQEAVRGWLDRQAQITAKEQFESRAQVLGIYHELMGQYEEQHVEVANLREKVAELTEGRDELVGEVNHLMGDAAAKSDIIGVLEHDRDDWRAKAEQAMESYQDAKYSRDHLTEYLRSITDWDPASVRDILDKYERGELLRGCDRDTDVLIATQQQREACADMVEQLWHAYNTPQMVNRSLWERWASCHRKLADLEYERGFVAATDEEMAKHGWMRLPVDADGETIRLGDVVQYRDEKPFAVTMIGYYPNIAGKVFWQFKGAGTPVYGEGCRDELHHYHAPTIGDVLVEMLEEFADGELTPYELSYKYADKLQLKDNDNAD